MVNTIEVDHWDSSAEGGFTGPSSVEAKPFAKAAVLLILLLPLSWIPGVFGWYERKRRQGDAHAHTAAVKDVNGNNA